MYNVYAVCNLPPAAVVAAIKAKAKQLGIKTTIFNPTKPLRQNITFMFGVSSLSEMLLIAVKNKIANTPIIFDCKAAVTEREGITIIDEGRSPKQLANWLISRLNFSAPVAVPVFKSDAIIRTMLKQAEKKYNFLSSYMTAFYQLPNKEKRDNIKKVIVDYMMGKIPKTKVSDRLMTFSPKRGAARQKFVNFCAIVNNEAGNQVRMAIEQVMKKRMSIDAASVKYDVSTYNIRYFLHTAGVLTNNESQANKDKRRQAARKQVVAGERKLAKTGRTKTKAPARAAKKARQKSR